MRCDFGIAKLFSKTKTLYIIYAFNVCWLGGF